MRERKYKVNEDTIRALDLWLHNCGLGPPGTPCLPTRIVIERGEEKCYVCGVDLATVERVERCEASIRKYCRACGATVAIEKNSEKGRVVRSLRARGFLRKGI